MEEDLDLERIISLIESPAEELKIYVEESDLEEQELETLLKAEKSAKNRAEVVNYLNQKLRRGEQHQGYREADIGTLKAVQGDGGEPHFVLDINGIKFELDDNPSLNFAGHVIEPVYFQDDLEPRFRVREAPGGSVAGQEISPSQFFKRQQGGGAPASSPNLTEGAPDSPGMQSGGGQPQTGKLDSELDELQDKIDRIEQKKEELKEKYGVEEERLEGKSYHELEAMEKNLEEREEKKQSIMDRFDVPGEELEDRSLEALEELEDRLEEEADLKEELSDAYSGDELDGRSLEELKDLKNRLERKREQIKQNYDVEEEKLEGKDISQLEDFIEELEARKNLAQKLQGFGYDEEDVEGKNLQELEKMLEAVEEKKALIDKLGLDFDEGKLAEVDIDQLRGLEQEKKERQRLIDELEEFGFDPEQLRESSTEDLKKLRQDVDGSPVQEYREILARDNVMEIEQQIKQLESPDYQKLLDMERDGKQRGELINFLENRIERRKTEYQEEAEEDLEMLMGAKYAEENEGEEQQRDPLDGLKNFPEQMKQRWSQISQKESGAEEKKRYEKVRDLLEEYRQLNRHEAAVKTAHVMKGYLEYKLGITRELTYGELADTLENVEDPSTDLSTLQEFFEAMQREQYAGQITLEVDSVIDSAEHAVKVLH